MAETNNFSLPTNFTGDVTFYKNVNFAGGSAVVPNNITTLSQTLTSGQSNQNLMADGSTTTNYVSFGTTPTSNDVGNDGDIWYTLC